MSVGVKKGQSFVIYFGIVINASISRIRRELIERWKSNARNV